MAKIYGIEVKNIKELKGHEGEPLIQCNVYVDGKKVGYFREGDYGGPSEIILERENKRLGGILDWADQKQAMQEEILRREKAYLQRELGEQYPSDFLDGRLLICQLLLMKALESEYKKILKMANMICSRIMKQGINTEKHTKPWQAREKTRNL